MTSQRRYDGPVPRSTGICPMLRHQLDLADTTPGALEPGQPTRATTRQALHLHGWITRRDTPPAQLRTLTWAALTFHR
jgi:hypothetical protein